MYSTFTFMCSLDLQVTALACDSDKNTERSQREKN